MDIYEIDKLVKGYIMDCLTDMGKTIEDLDGMDDEEYEDVRFKVSNDWKNGYDFVAFYTKKGWRDYDMLDAINILSMVRDINEFYEETYGVERIIPYKELTVANVLRHYVYFYMNNVFTQEQLAEELREYAEGDEEEDEDEDDE